MNVFDIGLGLRLTVGKRKIAFWESETSWDYLGLKVDLDEKPIGELKLSKFNPPGFAVSRSTALIWGNTRAYAISLKDGGLASVDVGDAIHTAYIVDGRWVFVCETSIRVFDECTASQIAHYDHNEVLSSSLWSGDRLFVEDFQGRRMYFEPMEPNPTLTPHEVQDGSP